MSGGISDQRVRKRENIVKNEWDWIESHCWIGDYVELDTIISVLSIILHWSL